MTSIVTANGARVMVGVIVTNTQYVVPLSSAPYFEVTVGTSADGPHPATLLTKNRRVYQDALDAENTGERLEVEWEPRTRDGQPVRELLAIRRSV